MSLATTCPSCSTCFRVVQDQLKVSEGWVRCGHCHDVFNALEGLFELDAVPAPAPAPALHTEPDDTGTDWNVRTQPLPPHAVVEDISPEAVALPDSTSALANGALPTEPFNAAASPSTTASAPEISPPEQPDDRAPEATPPAVLPEEEPMPSVAQLLVAADEATAVEPAAEDATNAVDPTPQSIPEEPAVASTEPAADGSGADPVPTDLAVGSEAPVPPPLPLVEAEQLPSFVQRAERQARWERPGVRATLVALTAVLAVGMAAQVAWHRRDRLAFVWPATQPLLSHACQALDCTLQAPRMIDAVQVDNTALTRPPGLASTDGGYRLTVTLHNRVEHPVAAPNLMLELNDAQGNLLVRRVLQPSDFHHGTRAHGASANVAIDAQGDATWTLDFTTTEHRIAGYTVAAFYP